MYYLSKKTKYLTISLLVSFMFLFSVRPLFAAGNQYIAKAKEFITKNCYTNEPTAQNSILCFIFDKVLAHEIQIDALNRKVARQEVMISSMSARLQQVEILLTPTITLAPTDIPTITPTLIPVTSLAPTP